MSRTQTWRIVITLILVLASFYYIWPTVKYWTMTQNDKDRLQASNPAEYLALKEKAIRLGLDLQAGMHLVYRVQMEKIEEKARENAVERALQIIRNRVDKFGLTEPIIQKSGTDRIIVDLPGYTDAERAQKLIGETAQLQFKLMESFDNADLLFKKIDSAVAAMRKAEQPGGDKAEETTPSASDNAAATDSAAPDLLQMLGTGEDGSTAVDDDFLAQEELEKPFSTFLEALPQSGTPIYMVEKELMPNIVAMLEKPAIKRLVPNTIQLAWATRSEIYTGREMIRFYVLMSRVQLSGEYLTNASEQIDQYGSPIVNFQLTRKGGKIFARVTGDNINKPLAIVLDGRVESAPNISSRIRDRGQITMGSGATLADARMMAITLETGALPAPVEIIESHVVGPSLGQDSINKGLTSAVVALIIVMVFIAIYYRVSGLVANGAMMFNVFFLMSAMAAIPGVALTMPGIAGIILTIGISVDSNVLIFERIREELLTKKSIRASIDAGYNRALLTIIDSHVTTLITAAILFMFGSGPVKGFAVTLFLGVSISLYTALVITRAIFDFRKGGKSLSI